MSALALLSSCSPDILVVGVKSGSGTVVFGVDYDARPGELADPGSASRERVGHPWFPLTPGRYTDFRILRYPSTEPTYVRATLGEPEEFFDRLATPWVYGPVPGLPVDESLEGLRQYFSVDAAGALRMHGSQNDGIMSYMEPPIRYLPPEPAPGATWIDTTYFRSFFPGMVPIFAGAQTYASTLSARAFLDLPGTPVHALRRSQVIDIVRRAGRFRDRRSTGSMKRVATGLRLRRRCSKVPRPELALTVARNGQRDRPTLVAEKGIWFARSQGIVARDYPHGVGPDEHQHHDLRTDRQRLRPGAAPATRALRPPRRAGRRRRSPRDPRAAPRMRSGWRAKSWPRRASSGSHSDS